MVSSSRPRLYFAYGSNLALAQMASRCPASYYIGRAVLPDYQWQINERGYANVIARPGYSVHGLVYELLGDDEARLDRSEGVSSGAYAKALRTVMLHPAPLGAQVKTKKAVKEGLELGGRPERPARLERNVLVYLSEVYVTWGRPREEYIDRMNNGLRDAMALGVPSAYFENAVRVSIPEPLMPRQAPAAWVGELSRRPPSRAQIVTGRSGRARSVSACDGSRSWVWESGDPRRQSWTPSQFPDAVEVLRVGTTPQPQYRSNLPARYLESFDSDGHGAWHNWPAGRHD